MKGIATINFLHIDVQTVAIIKAAENYQNLSEGFGDVFLAILAASESKTFCVWIIIPFGKLNWLAIASYYSYIKFANLVVTA